MKRVLFITSNSIATNPRLVKELKLASQKYECTVLSFSLSNWSDTIDEELRLSLPRVFFRVLSAGRNPFFPWLFSSLLERIAKLLYPLSKQSLFLNSIAHSKRSYLLWTDLKDDKKKYDFVIAHNLAALYPAYKFAKDNIIPFAFDIEDFHPGEKIDRDVKNEKERRIILMRQLLPNTKYVSYASPLIGEAVLRIIDDKSNLSHFLINNSFHSSEFIKPKSSKNNKLNVVWFSQNIAAGRGLELFIPILFEFKDFIQITLIGSLNASFYNSILKKYTEFVNYQGPLSQESLHRLLSEFDVGLAIESADADLNRDFCLTNKIFAYAQAGLYVLATNTKGQSQFMEQYPWIGELVGYTSSEIRHVFKNLIERKNEIKRSASTRYDKSKILSWELEQVKLNNIWESIDRCKSS